MESLLTVPSGSSSVVEPVDRSFLRVGAPAFARVRQSLGLEGWLQRALIVLAGVWLVVGILLPLLPVIARSLQDAQGQFVGLANYSTYFANPAFAISFYNSMQVGVFTTLVSVGLGFGYAYALTRTGMAGKRFFQTIALAPLYAPSMAHAIGLIYLFGKKGVVTTGGLGYLQPLLGFSPGLDIHLYGLTGIVLGEVLYCLPQAVLILTVAMRLTDARLYEASVALRASPLRTFFSVTLPSIKYGLVSAVFVCFTLAFTDFGVPKVVGGNFSVLATDIYKQVIGQQNFVMGATISILLLVPTVIAFVVDRLVQRRQVAMVSARIVPLRPKPNRWLDAAAFAFCALIALAILATLGAVLLAALVNVWPYRLDLTLRHFDFSQVGGGGYSAYWNSVYVAILTAVFGTALTFGSAYVIEKIRGLRWLRAALYFMSMLPVALPGLVIGLAYIFFFNPKHFDIAGLTIPNPLSFMYGSVAILVLANIVHFYTVSFLTATTSLKQLDPEFETVSASLGVPFYRTFWRVTLPLCVPAVLDIGMYYFVNAMVTVSAVIFLYAPTTRLASVAIVNMDDAGDTAAAAAMSVLVIATSVGVRLLYSLATHRLKRTTQAWNAP